MEFESELILEVLKSTGFKHDPDHGFELASGRRSDFYINCKPLLLKAPCIRALGSILFKRIWEACCVKGKIVQPNLVAGVAVGGIPLATAVSISSTDQFRLDSVIVRKEPKLHGTGMLIETPGTLSEWDNVVVVEDVVTTGGSSLATIDILRDAGCNVLGVFAIVDRLEGGREGLESADVHFESLFTRHDFIPGR